MIWILFLLILIPVYADSEVSIVNYEFLPKNVTIAVGDTVTWTNDADRTRHSFKLLELGILTPSLAQDESYSHTFTDVGEYTVQSTALPAAMQGKVSVVTELPEIESAILNESELLENQTVVKDSECCNSCDCAESKRCPDLDCTTNSRYIWYAIGILTVAFFMWMMRPKY